MRKRLAVTIFILLLAVVASLVARFASLEELRSSIEVDSLAYLKESDLVAAIGMPRDELCLACFNGEYLVEGNEGGFEL